MGDGWINANRSSHVRVHSTNSHKSKHVHPHYKNEKHSLQGKHGKTHGVC